MELVCLLIKRGVWFEGREIGDDGEGGDAGTYQDTCSVFDSLL